MKINVKHVADMKVLRSRGVLKAPRPTLGKTVTCYVESVTPKRIRLLESKYGQVGLEFDRKTGIEVGGSIIGYRMSRQDLNSVNRRTTSGLFHVYVRWFDTVFMMTPEQAYRLVMKVLVMWDKCDNLGVNFKDYGKIVKVVPTGAMVIDSSDSYGSKSFWRKMQEKLILAKPYYWVSLLL
jgi:hypothetical protein